MAVLRNTWGMEASHGGSYSIHRRLFIGGMGWGLHQHEYQEVFWVEGGPGVHHVNGASIPLVAGDLVCIRADDTHTFTTDPGERFSLVNLAFRPEDVADLAARSSDAWPWTTEAMPLHVHLPPAAMERLHGWTEDLASPGTTRIDLDAFLLDLVRLVARWRASGAEAGAPPWLREALEIFADPRHLAGGTPQLAKLCGRSPEQVNRQIRRWRGVTATEFVAELRLDWLARQLRLSDRPIAELSEACGLGHLGHCYQRFHKRFHTTPQRYRRDAWQLGGEGKAQ